MFKVINRSNRLLPINGKVLEPNGGFTFIDTDNPDSNLLRLKHNKIIDLIRVNSQVVETANAVSISSVKVADTRDDLNNSEDSPELLEVDKNNKPRNVSSKKSRRSKRHRVIEENITEEPEVAEEQEESVQEDNKDNSDNESINVSIDNSDKEVETVAEDDSSEEETEESTSENK